MPSDTSHTEDDRLKACVSAIKECISDINDIYARRLETHAPDIKRVMDTLKVNRRDAIRWLSENRWDAGRAISAYEIRQFIMGS